MIVEKLYDGEATVRKPGTLGVLRMSMSGACTRRLAYEYLGYTPEITPVDDRMAVVMQDGNLHEQDIVRRLLLKGFTIWNFGEGQTTVGLTYNGQRWRGHPDLFIKIGDETYGLDVKAFRGEVFNSLISGAEEVLPGRFVITDPMILTEGPFPVMGQMQLYLHSMKAVELGITKWIVLVKNKNTAELAECFIPKMSDYLDYVTSKWRGFWGYIATERLPERNFEKGSIQCRLCSYTEHCWGPLKELSQRTVELTDDSLIEAAKYWREGTALKKKSEPRIELARLRFERAAIESRCDRIMVDELEIQVNLRSRTGLDVFYVSKLLDTLRKNDSITDEEYSSCWDEASYTEVRVVDRRRST